MVEKDIQRRVMDDPVRTEVASLVPRVRLHGVEGARAVEGLARLGGKATQHICDAFVKEEDKMAKADLLWSLVLIGDAIAIPTIRAHGLTDGDLGVNEFSRWAIQRLEGGPPPLDSVREVVGSSPPIVNKGREVLPMILAVLDLGLIGTPETTETLLVASQAQGKYGQFVRGSAAWCLGKFNQDEKVRLALESMSSQDPDKEVREIAAYALEREN
jgi:HEAT repeat protein